MTESTLTPGEAELMLYQAMNHNVSIEGRVIVNIWIADIAGLAREKNEMKIQVDHFETNTNA